MAFELFLSPQGHLHVREAADLDGAALDGAVGKRVHAAFAGGTARGLLHLATTELQSSLPPTFGFARDFARLYLTRLCQTPADGEAGAVPPIPQPSETDLAFQVLHAPPMHGCEYLSADVLATWWSDLDLLVRAEVEHYKGGVQAYLSERNPQWRLVGRVTFHLAENKRDEEHPFAFLATFIPRLSAKGSVQHEPLGKALQQYAGAKNRAALLSLLVPIQRATERSSLIKEMFESGEIYHPLAWTPREAYRFLQDIPVFEESGLVVRVPDWWKSSHPPRPVVNVKIDARKKSTLSVSALLDFSVNVTLEGEPLTESELEQLLESVGGLVAIKGKWVEVDREKLAEALQHWKKVERDARKSGLSFYEGMRLLSGVPRERDATSSTGQDHEWVGLTAGAALEETLKKLRSPESLASTDPPGLRAQLRPYQQTGVSWLRFVTGLGLGACLADDMGLGKTVQVIGLLLHRKSNRKDDEPTQAKPSLLVVPASLLANWKAELERFAPTISFLIAHPSGNMTGNRQVEKQDAQGLDLLITTYGMLSRTQWLREHDWDLVILDEAQAIKNSGTRQSRTVKELKSAARVVMTGTPVENRLSDLWSLFDFLNPGLLGGAKAFADFVKQMEARASYQPLRTLVGPYILRRLKTDKRVIADLPEKVEMSAFCTLSREQAALYEQAVRDLAQKLEVADGIQRRGLVLAQLMKLKQICNHPAQLVGTGDYAPEHSGKFQRLAEICEELGERQEKALVFTQFREITGPLAQLLEGVFGRPGLVLHGGTPVAQRRRLVESFQREDGPPFFVLSLKAGGTGLNLTAACHVIHFDRWWNPAVENQATDRTFRIGQTRNVLVHKFVCRGTVEERIDAMIAEKKSLSGDVIDGAETLLTEMSDKQLLDFVRLDVHKALDN
ncbi:MAG: DEAD/DEAH box helicase [Planctomycetaceae bacterium]|nr:DEAD/DEAH box helicase [Planctomycetaceae bacterium]